VQSTSQTYARAVSQAAKMVTLNQIQASNAQLTDETVPQVSVFIGGTSGLGKATIECLANLKLAVKIYIVGRKSTEPAMRIFMDELRKNNSRADLIWVEAEVALLSEVKRACAIIKQAESKVDLLFLSAGYAPLSGRVGMFDQSPTHPRCN
jgi:NAD(P)-dependent dehydrogenase (short-subunit alcohol dehydrogenase family)